MSDYSLDIDMEFTCHECGSMLKVYKCNPELNRFKVKPCSACDMDDLSEEDKSELSLLVKTVLYLKPNPWVHVPMDVDLGIEIARDLSERMEKPDV